MYFLQTPKSRILQDWEEVIHKEKITLINNVMNELQKFESVTNVFWEERYGNIWIMATSNLEEITDEYASLFIKYQEIFYERFDIAIVFDVKINGKYKLFDLQDK